MKKEKLKQQYEKACCDYLQSLIEAWDLDSYYGYWIGEEVGGVWDYGGDLTITMEDIIYCVENEVTEAQYTGWQEYICDASEFGFDTPNLRSWMRGCPRTPSETFERLRKMKADLNKAVKEEKERVKTEEKNNPY